MDYYPREFSREARNRVEKEVILARRAIGDARRILPAPWSRNVSYPSDEFEQAFFASILRVFLVFAEDAVQLCHTGDWGLDRADRESKEFLRRLTITWRHEEGRDRGGNQVREVCGNWGGCQLERWVDEKFRSRPEWTRYEDLFLGISGGVSTLKPSSGPEAESTDSQAADVHLDLLEAILAKGPTTIEKWARDHKLGRTTVFDWKAARLSGKSPKGKVSDPKSAEIEKAIEKDAKALGLELGLAARTDSD